MEGPTYVTLSAQMALQKQLEVVANNIANANTSGFKADRQVFEAYVEDLNVPGGSISFVQDRATFIDRQQGAIQMTGNPLDIAIKGDGFLSVQGTQGTEYTRDGHMQVANDGTLTDSSGRSVLTADGSTIQLPQNYQQVDIKGDGTMMVLSNKTWQTIGQIGLFRSSNPVTMRKAGDGLLTGGAGGMQPVDADDTSTRVVQGSLESSTVETISEIANLTELSRAYERLQTLLSDDNDRERKMIAALGSPT